MSNGLVEFLRARLDEDEQIARAACWDDQSDVWTARPPRASYERYTVVDYLGDGVVAVTPENADDDGVGQHIARQDPHRVLREIDAKRGIVARYEFVCRQAVELGLSEEERETWVQVGGALQSCVLCLAAVYADHPDYREEWRP